MPAFYEDRQARCLPAKRHSMPPSPPPPKPPPHWLLRRTEQVTVAILIAAGLLSVIGWWIYHGGVRGRTVEIERAEPQTARFQVDINKADWPELATLPGVGRKMAERIVQSREQDGPLRRYRRPASRPRHRCSHPGDTASLSAADAPPGSRGRKVGPSLTRSEQFSERGRS